MGTRIVETGSVKLLCSVIMVLVAVGVSNADIIIDNNNSHNTEGSFSVLSGTWSTGSSATGKWEDNYRYNSAGGTLSEVSWVPEISEAGEYEVATYYPAGASRTANAPFTIYHANGSTLVAVDQQVNGGQWFSLGTFTFNAGTGGYVVLSDQASSGAVIADAIRFKSMAYDPPQFRGFWVDAFGVGFKSTSQIDTMVARAVAGGYNAIVAEVLAFKDTSSSDNGHGAYWESNIIPRASVVTGGFDPLEYLCQKAHQNGLEVHAWLVAYRVSTSWPPYGNSTIASHPEWLSVYDYDMGSIASVGGHYILDPGNPEVQEYIVETVREIVENYEVDGINFDYIRYTSSYAGYPAVTTCDKSSLARFRELTGYVGTPDYNDSNWSDFRRQTINELIRRCRAEIPAITSNPMQPICLSADLICAGGAPADFTDSSPYGLFQDWKLWLEKGWVDAGMTMNYKDDRNSTHAAYYRSWIDAAVDYSGDRHVYCGQGNYMNSKANSVVQMEYVYNAGAQGTVNYSYRATADEDDDDVAEADWTWYSYVGSNLFTNPALTPALSWRNPALATEGTIWGQVTDYDTGEPVDGADVRVNGYASEQTDGNGYYVLTLLPATAAGTDYEVIASHDEYDDDFHRSVTVYAGDVSRMDLQLGTPPLKFDFDDDGLVNISDLPAMRYCLSGPDVVYTGEGHFCLTGDSNGDSKVDLSDFAVFQQVFTAE